MFHPKSDSFQVPSVCQAPGARPRWAMIRHRSQVVPICLERQAERQLESALWGVFSARGRGDEGWLQVIWGGEEDRQGERGPFMEDHGDHAAEVGLCLIGN